MESRDYETINSGLDYVDDAIEKLEKILGELNATLIDDNSTSIEVFKSFASNTLEDLRTARASLVASASRAQDKEKAITG